MELDPLDTAITPQEREVVKAILHPMMGAIAGMNNGHVSAADTNRLLAFAAAAILMTTIPWRRPRISTVPANMSAKSLLGSPRY